MFDNNPSRFEIPLPVFLPMHIANRDGRRPMLMLRPFAHIVQLPRILPRHLPFVHVDMYIHNPLDLSRIRLAPPSPFSASSLFSPRIDRLRRFRCTPAIMDGL